MNKKLLTSVIALAAGILAFAQTPADTSLTLTLDQCIEIALSENPTIHVADMEITRLDLSRKETIGQLLPRVSFDGSYSRMLAKQVAYMNMDNFPGMGDLGGGTGGDDDQANNEGISTQKAGGGGDRGIKMGLDNSYQVGFSASLPLIAPQLWKAIDLSDTQILQSIDQARTSRQSLVAQVKNAYYTLLLARDSYQVVLQNRDMARFTAELYEKKYAAGAATKYDVLRTQVALSNIEPEITRAEIAIRQSRLQLLLLMGIGQYLELNPAVTLADMETGAYDTAMSLPRDISGNPSLRQLDLNTKLLDQTLELKKMAFYPTLSLTASYNWTSSSNGNPLRNFRWNPFSMIGLTLSFPIFQGGTRYNQLKQAQVQVNEMKWQRENLVNSINTQVNVAFDNMTLNLKQIASCAETVKQATTAHSIVSQSFEIGAATYLDLRDAELSLTTARLARLQAVYDYLVATANLEQLLGSYNVEQFMPAQ